MFAEHAPAGVGVVEFRVLIAVHIRPQLPGKLGHCWNGSANSVIPAAL